MIYKENNLPKEIPIGRAKDKRGQIFGRLEVVYRVENHLPKTTSWLCKCSCLTENPNYIIATGNHLVTGDISSCGCLAKENGHKMGLKNIHYIHENNLGFQSKDLTNQKFGKLTALYPTDKRKNGHIVWCCKCDCGNFIYVNTSDLHMEHTQSCGLCNHISKGELKISQLLKENNIQFETQKTFDSCRFSDTNALAKFDFYVNNKYLIEFDGIQHFEYRDNGWNNEENFKRIKQHDEYKNKWCKDNNIPLIRIPYWHLDNLCIEDLLYHN